MPPETDLPCSDCGGELAELTVDVRSLPGPTVVDDNATVALCPNCHARFYPEQTLVQLFPDGPDLGRGGVTE